MLEGVGLGLAGTILLNGVFQPGKSRGHRPPGSGEAVAFSFAGMGSSHGAIVAVLERD